MTAHHWTPDQVATAIAAAPRGVWLAGHPSPTVGFFPRTLPSTGYPLPAPYPCVCRPGDSWACRNGRCGCSGRERSLQPSQRPSGYGASLPAPLAGVGPSCCAIVALMSGGYR